MVRLGVARDPSLLGRAVALGREAAELLAEDGFSARERAVYRAAVEDLLAHLRAAYASADDLAVAYYAEHDGLLARAAAACGGNRPWERVSPVLALDAAVFERARELAGLDP